MRRVIVVSVAASLLALSLASALAGCGGHAAPAPLANKVYIDNTGDTGVSEMGTSIGVPGQVVLTVSDDESNHPASHWSLKLPAGVRLVSSKLDDPTISGDAIGVRSLTFAIAQPGTYVVRGTYAHPGHKPARRFTVRIYGNPPGWPPPNLVFTDAHNGLGTNPGQTFVIALEERPGGAWVLHFGPRLKVLHQMTVTPAPSSNPAVDDGSQHLWLFRVEKTGKTSVTGSYSGPSAPAAPFDTFSLNISSTPPNS